MSKRWNVEIEQGTLKEGNWLPGIGSHFKGLLENMDGKEMLSYAFFCAAPKIGEAILVGMGAINKELQKEVSNEQVISIKK